MSTVISNMTEDAPQKIIKKVIPGPLSTFSEFFGTTQSEEIPLKKKCFEDPQIGTKVKIIR